MTRASRRAASANSCHSSATRDDESPSKSCIRGSSKLKKAQDVLGDLHDRQELVDNFAESCPADTPEICGQLSLLKQVIEAENHGLHARYLGRRAALLDICDREQRSSHRASARSLAAAGALVISSGIFARRR